MTATDDMHHPARRVESQRRYPLRMGSEASEAAVAAGVWVSLAATSLLSRHAGTHWVWSHIGLMGAYWAYPRSGRRMPKAPRRRPQQVPAVLAVLCAAGVVLSFVAVGWSARACVALGTAMALRLSWVACSRVWPSDGEAYGAPWSEVWHSPTERRRAFEGAAINAFEHLRRLRGAISEEQASRLARAAADAGLHANGDRLSGDPRRIALAEGSASALAAWGRGCVSWWDHEGAPHH